MKFIIQSFSDIITNSSSEVFVSTKNEELINILKDWGIFYIVYETEEELRKAVEESPWDFEDITTYNPYSNCCLMEDLVTMKSKDSIWDFFKSFYINLIGKIIVDVDRDYLYRKQYDNNINIFKYITQ